MVIFLRYKRKCIPIAVANYVALKICAEDDCPRITQTAERSEIRLSYWPRDDYEYRATDEQSEEEE